MVVIYPFSTERVCNLIKIFIAIPFALLASCVDNTPAESARTEISIQVSIPEDEIVIVHQAAYVN